MAKRGTKSRNNRVETPLDDDGGGGLLRMPKRGTKSRNNAVETPRGEIDMEDVTEEEDALLGGSSTRDGVSTRSGLRLRIRIGSPQREALGATGNVQPQILGVSTPDGQSSQPQPDDRNAPRCINSVMQSKPLSTREGTHAPCLNQSDSIPSPENQNEKRKQITRRRTPNDQRSPVSSVIDKMEEELTTLVPTGCNLLSKNSSSLLPQTQPQVVQDRGSLNSNNNYSPLLPSTGNEKSKRLLEKFLKMRNVVEKDRNTLQLLETLIQHDAHDADSAVRVKPEPICLDLEDEVVYIVGKDCEHTLRKIMSVHGDIAKSCCFPSVHLRTYFLEMVCKIYKKLEASNIFEIDFSEMSPILETLDQLQDAKMEVKWLIDRLTQRIELTEELSRTLTLRYIDNRKASEIEQRAAMFEVHKSELEYHKARIKSLEKMLKEEEEELASEKRVSDVIKLFSGLWQNKVKPLGQPLAHGLL